MRAPKTVCATPYSRNLITRKNPLKAKKTARVPPRRRRHLIQPPAVRTDAACGLVSRNNDLTKRAKEALNSDRDDMWRLRRPAPLPIWKRADDPHTNALIV
jgi:hypothetical protein